MIKNVQGNVYGYAPTRVRSCSCQYLRRTKQLIGDMDDGYHVIKVNYNSYSVFQCRQEKKENIFFRSLSLSSESCISRRGFYKPLQRQRTYFKPQIQLVHNLEDFSDKLTRSFQFITKQYYTIYRSIHKIQVKNSEKENPNSIFSHQPHTIQNLRGGGSKRCTKMAFPMRLLFYS